MSSVGRNTGEHQLARTTKTLESARYEYRDSVESGGRRRDSEVGAWKLEKKHLTLVKRGAAGSPRSPFPVPCFALYCAPFGRPTVSHVFFARSLPFYLSCLFAIVLSFSLRLSLGETFIGSSLCRRSLQHRRRGAAVGTPRRKRNAV